MTSPRVTHAHRMRIDYTRKSRGETCFGPLPAPEHRLPAVFPYPAVRGRSTGLRVLAYRLPAAGRSEPIPGPQWHSDTPALTYRCGGSTSFGTHLFPDYPGLKTSTRAPETVPPSAPAERRQDHCNPEPKVMISNHIQEIALGIDLSGLLKL